MIIQDELSRTREFREECRRKIEHLRKINAPPVIIEQVEFISTMTYTQHKQYCAAEEARQLKEQEEEKRLYRSENPPDQNVANLIWSKFDAWFAKYYDDEEKLMDELDTSHNFEEPWFWGSIPPGAEAEFYEHILDENDYAGGNYDPVFEVCREKIRARLRELGVDIPLV